MRYRITCLADVYLIVANVGNFVNYPTTAWLRIVLHNHINHLLMLNMLNYLLSFYHALAAISYNTNRRNFT